MLESAVYLCVDVQCGQRDTTCAADSSRIIAGFLVFSDSPFHFIYRIFDVGICAAIRSQCLYDHCRHINVGAGKSASMPQEPSLICASRLLIHALRAVGAGRIVVIVAGIQCNQCKCCAVVAPARNAGAAVLLKQRFNKVVDRAVGPVNFVASSPSAVSARMTGILGMLGLRIALSSLVALRS